jgi:hypothetical protein
MADSQTHDELPVIDTQPVACRHLRSNGMYVYTDGTTKETVENIESTVYWCMQTMKSFGPEGEMVGGRESRHTTRSCYQPL